jgi:hypothetical protein
MDVAQTQRGAERSLLTIAQYLQLPPHQRPTELWCAGTADHGPCQGPAFPKALDGAVTTPHFASLHHAPGCDHAAPSPTALSRLHHEAPETVVLHLVATPATPQSAPRPAHPHHRHEPHDPRASLHSALRALTGSGLPDELLVQWRQQPPLLAYKFFIHLNSAATARDEPRGYWGRIATVTHHERTRSTHLTPRTGARIVIDAATSVTLQLHEPDTAQTLSDAAILAIGPLRRARSGSLYVLVREPGAIASLP